MLQRVPFARARWIWQGRTERLHRYGEAHLSERPWLHKYQLEQPTGGALVEHAFSHPTPVGRKAPL
jgi:hypothetical protein